MSPQAWLTLVVTLATVVALARDLIAPVTAMMGAESVKELLQRLDLDALAGTHREARTWQQEQERVAPHRQMRICRCR